MVAPEGLCDERRDSADGREPRRVAGGCYDRRMKPFPLGRVAVGAAVAGAIVTRLLHIDPHLNPDAFAFESIARSLLAGHGFAYRESSLAGLDLYAFRAPAYPVFVALALAAGGVSTLIAIQGSLNGLTAALVGSIAGWLGGSRAAWIAFAIRLAWPAAWFHSALVMSEIFYEALIVIATWLVLEAIERRRISWIALSGLLTTAAMLTRPVGLGLAAALGIWLLIRWRRGAVVFALAVLLSWAPWPIRNAERLHAFVPFTTLGGATAFTGASDQDVGAAFQFMSSHVEMGEVGLDRYFYAQARARVLADPGAAFIRAARFALVYLGPIRGRARELWVHRFAMLAALPALALALWRRRLTLPFLIWGAQGVLLLPVLLIDRYRFPTEWCVVIAAGLGLAALAERIGSRRAVIASAIALAVCIVGTLAVAR